MLRNLRQNAVILTVVLSLFALSVAAAENGITMQTRKSAKPTPTPAKKTAKATPTPPKKSAIPTTAKSKTKVADKKTTAAKTPTKTSAKDKNSKTAANSKETSSKKTASTKSNLKTDDKKIAASKSSKTNSKTAAKNSKTEPPAKKIADSKRTTAAKEPVKKPAPPTKNIARTPVKTENKENLAASVPQIIVTDVSARIRSQAKSNATEITHPKLGAVLKVVEKTPAWYRVQFSDGSKTASGWISANSVNDLNSAGKDQLYRQIADRYYKPNGMDFATASELYEFLNGVSINSGAADSAELELKKLLALRSALKSIPTGKSNETPYRDFLKAHEKEVVYSEPAGEWYENSNLFWDLHKKYEKSPLADQIAWEGAQNPLPGECEGYVNCYLFYARMTSGEYLSLHPTGKNNLEALNNITNFLEPIAAGIGGNTSYNGPTDVTDRAEFNNLIAELRTIISRLPLTEKEKPLQLLKKIAEGFR